MQRLSAVLPGVCRQTSSAVRLAAAAAFNGERVRWATSKSGGSTRNGRDSNPQYLGVKKYGGQHVIPGNIILRQRGHKYGIVESTASVAFGKDDTIYALKPGYVKFWWHNLKKKNYVEVVQSPVGVEPVVKYPIVRLKKGDLPQLMKLVDSGESVSLSPDIEKELAAYRIAVALAAPSGGRKYVPPQVVAAAGASGAAGGAKITAASDKLQ